MRLRFTLIAAAALLGSAAALADPLTIDIPGGDSAERKIVTYACSGGRKVTAEYVNAGANSLAIATVGEQTILMASVLSGSGARYAGQQYVWWTKGNSADFYDLTKGDDAPPEFSCEAE